MVLSEKDLNFAKCKGYSCNSTGHICNKLYTDIVEIQKTKILNSSTISGLIRAMNTGCFASNYNTEICSLNRKNLVDIMYNHIVKTENCDEFLYKNSYFLTDMHYIFTITNQLANENKYNLIENIYNKIFSTEKNKSDYMYDPSKFVDYIYYVFELYKKNLVKINENILIEFIYNNFNNFLIIDTNNGSYNSAINTKIKTNLNTIISYFLTNKNFHATYDNFIKCLVYDKFKNAQLMLTSPNVKIKLSSLSEYLNLLFKLNLTNSNYDDITNCVNFLVENNFDKNIDISELILDIDHDDYAYRSRYGRQTNTNKIKIYEYIFNTLVDNGCKIKKDDLLTLLKNHIYIKNPQKCGIDVNDDDISSLCYSLSYNPYGLKFKYTEKLLELESDKSGNLKKIKEICKTIQPSVKCLENSCKYKNNYATIKYFIDIKKLKTNIDSIANAIKANGGTSYTYIVDAFYKDKIKIKTEPKIEPKVEPKVEPDNMSVCSDDTTKTTDSTKKKKKIIKKIIKKVVKKKTTEENTEENTEETELKPKKVVKKKITEENTEETESSKSYKSTKSDKVVKKKITEETTDETDSIQSVKSKKNKIINLDEFKIPNNYNYKEKYKIKNTGKNIINSTENLNHISARRLLLEYLKENNKLKHEIEFNNIKFKLNNIDKFISAHILEY